MRRLGSIRAVMFIIGGKVWFSMGIAPGLTSFLTAGPGSIGVKAPQPGSRACLKQPPAVGGAAIAGTVRLRR